MENLTEREKIKKIKEKLIQFTNNVINEIQSSLTIITSESVFTGVITSRCWLLLRSFSQSSYALASTTKTKAAIIKRHGEQAAPRISSGCNRATTVENFLLRDAGSGDEQFHREQPFVKPGTSRVCACYTPGRDLAAISRR